MGVIRGQVAIRNLGVQTGVAPLLQHGVMRAADDYHLLQQHYQHRLPSFGRGLIVSQYAKDLWNKKVLLEDAA